MKKRYTAAGALYPAIGIGFAACLTLRADVCAEAVRAALGVCGRVLIPSIFPFMAATGIILGAGGAEIAARLCGRTFARVFRMPPALCAAFVIGLISGFPLGAITAVRVYESGGCTREEAERSLALVSNAGPAYVIAGIGGMLGDVRLGAALFAVQIAASFAVNALAARRYPRTEYKAENRSAPPVSGLLTRAVKGSVTPMLDVCGFVIVFAPVTALMLRGLTCAGAPGAATAAALSVVELTNAAGFAAKLPTDVSLPVIAFAVSFSGLCVAAQIAAVAADAGLSTGRYIKTKLLSGITSALIARLICFLL